MSTKSRASFSYAGPLPPSVNHTWGHRGKIKFLNKETRDFRARVKKAFLESECAKKGPMTGDVEYVCKLCPRNKRSDLDNYLKQPLDALQHAGVFADDRQVVRIDAELCRCRL